MGSVYVCVILTQLFFFISLLNMSSNFPLPPKAAAAAKGDVFKLDFFGIEKSWTSLKSIGPFNISAMFNLGKL